MLVAAAGTGIYAKTLDPFRVGTSHRIVVQIMEPCGAIGDFKADGRNWRADGVRPVGWPQDGGVEGVLRVDTPDVGLFEADGGGTVTFRRLPGGSFSGGHLSCSIS
jgi:hypothetical protein